MNAGTRSPLSAIERVKRANFNQATDTENPDDLRKPRVIKLFWLRMTEMYGQRWLNSFGDAPSPYWLKFLNELTEDDIKRGLRACLERIDKYPPSMPEFKALCRKKTIAYFTAKPKPVVDKAKVAEELCKIKIILSSDKR